MTENNEMKDQLLSAASSFINEADRKVEELTNEVSAEANSVMPESTLTSEDILEEINKAPMEVPKEAPMEAIIENEDFDINNITILDNSSDIDLITSEKILFEANKGMQIVATQSFYSGEISGLNNEEIQAFATSNLDLYRYKSKQFKTVYKHLSNLSIGPLKAYDWLKLTSYFDYETFLYGIFCQTFPEKNEFNEVCSDPDCGHDFKIYVDNESLTKIEGDAIKTLGRIEDVISRTVTPEQALKENLVSKSKRVKLSNKILVDIQIPSCYTYLEEILKSINDEDEIESDNVNLNLFIKAIYIPTGDYIRGGKPSYLSPIVGVKERLDILKKLSLDDQQYLINATSDFTNLYKIDYSIKSNKCPKCGKETGDTPIGFEELLFRTIRRKKNGKKS